MRRLALPGCLLLAAPAFSQSEVWVDPVIGSDSASGTSPTDPWRTITYAALQVDEAGTIHLLPGTYDTATGESFPIALPAGVTVRGAGDAEEVVVRPSASESAFSTDAGGQLETLRIERGDQVGAGVTVAAGTCRLVDVQISGVATGVLVRFFSTAVLEDCDVSHNVTGARLLDGARIEAVDTTFASNSSHGLAAFHSYGEEVSYFDLTRCRVVDQGEHGIFVWTFFQINEGHIRVHDSLIAGNGGGGIVTYSYEIDVSITGSTVAHNLGDGVVAGATYRPVEVVDSIVAGNAGGDLWLPTSSLTTSLVGDATGTLEPGNLAGDPGFVDPSSGDYRLRFDSPCIDSASGQAAVFDLDRVPRTVDGDLDLGSAADIGALEHRTLSASPLGDAPETSSGRGQHKLQRLLLTL
ncbi:MAG: right-handed parallel beta-helix repeat-containing protein [Planctomycetota bacterium]